MDFAAEGGVRSETRFKYLSQLVERAFQLGLLSEGVLGVEPMVEEGECGGREVRGWRERLEPLHRETQISMILKGSLLPCAVVLRCPISMSLYGKGSGVEGASYN
ncbi:hypothetical protein E2542_SST13717 [Spatholobus suberectus]|nr:hypothetical protein E2542_SST13717 [Spatholobus suberectus]